MKMVRRTVQKVMIGYDNLYEENFVSEEEFVFDSIRNPELFRILTNTNIKMLHLTNDMAWDEPDEEFIKVVIADGENNTSSMDNESGDKS